MYILMKVTPFPLMQLCGKMANAGGGSVLNDYSLDKALIFFFFFYFVHSFN